MNIKAWMKKPIVSAILVNLIVLFGLLLVFEPTPKVDDYLPLMIFYGGFSGEYSPFLLYSNIVFGWILLALQNLVSSIPWYYVIQYILIFCGMTVSTYILQSHFRRTSEKIGGIAILLYLGYELYIRFTFTTVAGFLFVVAFFIFLYVLATDEHCLSVKILFYFCATVFYFFGYLIRQNMKYVGVWLFGTGLLVFFISNYKRLLNDKKKLCKSILYIFVTLSICLGLGKGLDDISNHAHMNDERWSSFFEYNGARSALQDFGWPDYDTYYEQYQELGVSRNDYAMWNELNNIADTDIYNMDLMKAIKSFLTDSEGETLSNKLVLAFKYVFSHFALQIEFYIVLAVLFFAFFNKTKKINWESILVFLAYMANFPLFYIYVGRVRHRVEVVFAMGAIILLLYFLRKERVERRNVYVVFALCAVFVTTMFYERLSDSDYGNAEVPRQSEEAYYEENYEKLKLMSEDGDHLFVLNMDEESGLFPGYTMSQVMEKGFFHNIYTLFGSGWPDCTDILQNYGVPGTNVFDGITENEAIYYVESPRCKGNYTIVTQYIKEHYDENVRCTKVKTVDDVNIFKFDSGELDVDYDVLSNSSLVTQQVEVKEKSDSKLTISGYAFVNGKDSFAQNIYLETTDNITGEQEYYYTLQKENTGLGNVDKYQGLYSKFSVNIKKSKLKGKEVRLILQVDGGTYALSVDVSQWIVE